MPQKSQHDAGRQIGGKARSSRHRDLQRRSLDRGFGDEACHRGRRLPGTDPGQGFERRDLLRDGSIETEPGEAPTERFQGGHGRDQPAAPRLHDQGRCIGDSGPRDRGDQSGITEIAR